MNNGFSINFVPVLLQAGNGGGGNFVQRNSKDSCGSSRKAQAPNE